MSLDQDFRIETAGRDLAPGEGTRPIVVIEYRRPGLLALLFPPLLIAAAAVVILGLRLPTPEWPGLVAMARQAQRPAPTPIAEDPRPLPAPPIVARIVEAPEPEAEANVSEVESPEAEAVLSAEGAAPAKAEAPVRADPPAISELPEDVREILGRLNDGARPAPAIGFDPPPAPKAPPTPPGRPGIGPTGPGQFRARLDIDAKRAMDAIREEAERQKARRAELEALKPRLMEQDRVEARRRDAEHYEAARRQAEEARRGFRRDLTGLIRDQGERAGPAIEQLCLQYGRSTHPAVRSQAAQLIELGRRLGRKALVQRLRDTGLPETMILDYLAGQEARRIGSRGGPRNDDEALVRAARSLLLIAPTAPVAHASTPTPSGGR